MRISNFGAVLFPASILVPFECFAGVTPPVDILGMGALLGGFVVLVVILATAGIWFATARVLLLLVIAAPIVTIGMYAANDKWVHAKNEDARKENERAFSLFCKERRKIIFKKALPIENKSIYVSDFTNPAYPPVQASRLLWFGQALCTHSSVKHLEQMVNAEYIAEKKGWSTEIRRYDVCENEAYNRWNKSTSIESNYDLIFGESRESANAPNARAPVRMLSISVRVLERRTGEPLAEDRIYYFGSSSGDGGCPKPEEQVLELIKEVFPQE